MWRDLHAKFYEIKTRSTQQDNCLKITLNYSRIKQINIKIKRCKLSIAYNVPWYIRPNAVWLIMLSLNTQWSKTNRRQLQNRLIHPSKFPVIRFKHKLTLHVLVRRLKFLKLFKCRIKANNLLSVLSHKVHKFLISWNRVKLPLL